MNNIPFSPIEYKKYKNTFLQTVVVSMSFKKNIGDQLELDNRFKEFINAIFGADLQKGSLANGVMLTKADGSIRMAFKNSEVVLIFSGQKYNSFSESVVPQLFNLRRFFKKVVEVKHLACLSIRKINVWNFRNDKKLIISAEDARNAVFSKDLIGVLSSDSLSDQEKELENCLKVEWKEAFEKITIRTVFNKPHKQDEFYQLLLDSEYKIKKDGGFEIEDIAEQLMDYNSVLYKAYHWCINEKVLKIMNQTN